MEWPRNSLPGGVIDTSVVPTNLLGVTTLNIDHTAQILPILGPWMAGTILVVTVSRPLRMCPPSSFGIIMGARRAADDILVSNFGSTTAVVGDWNSPATWDSGVVPPSATPIPVLINLSPITLDPAHNATPAYCSNLNIASGRMLHVFSGQTLSANGTLNIFSGTLKLDNGSTFNIGKIVTSQLTGLSAGSSAAVVVNNELLADTSYSLTGWNSASAAPPSVACGRYVDPRGRIDRSEPGYPRRGRSRRAPYCHDLPLQRFKAERSTPAARHEL